MALKVDRNITTAVKYWLKDALPPGTCTELLLRGQYADAFKHAHPNIKPYWDDHITFIEAIPLYCRNENYDKWKGLEQYEHRHELDEDLFLV